MVPPDIAAGMRAGAEASGENAIPVDGGFVRGMLATEADDATFEALMAKLIPQPLTMMTTPVDTKAFATLTIPMVFFHCAKDTSLPSGAYIGMFKAYGDNPFVEAACDYEGLFTNPEEYAKGLIEAIEL